MGNENDKGQKCRAHAERQFARYPEGEVTTYQITGKRAPKQATYPGRCAGYPCECAHRLDVKASSVVEIFWEPEQVEKPRCVTQELGCHQSPGFAETKKVSPGEVFYRVRNQSRRFARIRNNLPRCFSVRTVR